LAAPQGEYSLTKSALSPFHAEPTQLPRRSSCQVDACPRRGRRILQCQRRPSVCRRLRETQLIILKQEGRHVTGSGGPDDSEQYPISNGNVTADRVRFELTTARSKFFYDLKKTGTALSGSLEIKSLNNTATATVSLKKEQ
jgi:hypothetical protein